MLSLTTELEAVNIMLRGINEAPVTTLSGWAASSDIQKAIEILRETSKAFQTRGWSFNTDLKVTLTPDPGTGKIAYPTGAIRVEISGTYPAMPVFRAGFLYDTVAHTDVFTRTFVADKVVKALDYEDMPEAARYCIAINASRRFQDRVFGSQAIQQFSQREADLAYASLISDERKISRPNVFNNPDVLGDIKYGYR